MIAPLKKKEGIYTDKKDSCQGTFDIYIKFCFLLFLYFFVYKCLRFLQMQSRRENKQIEQILIGNITFFKELYVTQAYFLPYTYILYTLNYIR